MGKRMLSLLLIFICAFSLLPGGEAFALEETPGGSAQQIVSEGGEKRDEYLTVSKFISGTDTENVFDITLKVVTRRKIEELYRMLNTDVVVVMDISASMTNLLSDNETSRYTGAINAAKGFINSMFKKLEVYPDANLRLGFVTFNTNSSQVFGMTRLADTSAEALTDKLEKETGAIINAEDYDGSPERFTNIESGLKRGQALLEGSTAESKYIILLTDGLPTTYIKNGQYDGYGPPATEVYTSSYNDGQFADRKQEKPCMLGTSYSDRAAEKAQAMAAAIKDSGIKVFSVGVGLDGVSIQAYIDQHKKHDYYSVVDCYGESYKNEDGKDYVIGNANDEEAYKKWLKTKIGSDIYYNSENSEELADAFNNIFKTIEQETVEKIQASWTVSDPMGAVGAAKVEFIRLYDREGKFAADAHNLSGELGEGKENTVSVKDGAISWNLWRSGYTSLSQGNSTLYNYELKYRVRLENELKNFAEGSRVDTNGTTTLSYIHDKNGSLTPGSIDFPVPAVKGWLGELRFTKKNNSGDILPGAEFTLSHNDNCSVCAAMCPGGWKVDIGTKTAASATNGSVVFTDIPSGHDYSLTETNVPTGYLGVGSLPVTVDYDKLKVNGAADFESLVNFASCKLTVYKIISGDFSSADFAPGSFTIELIDADTDKLLREVSLPTEDGKWEYTFSGLPAGRYKLHESHWSIPQEGYVCKNSYIYPENGDCVELDWGGSGRAGVKNEYEYVPDSLKVHVHKTWLDANDRDGIRPESIEFTLRVGGKDIRPATANADNGFKVSFEYDRRVHPGKAIVYESGYTDRAGQYHKLELNGAPIPGYSFSLGEPEEKDASLSFEAYNSHNPDTTSIRLRKEWTEEAARNQKPITFRLYADGVEINSVTLDGKTGWEYTFTQDSSGSPLYVYSQGKKIDYSICEDSPGEYWTTEKQQDENGVWVFTNDYHVPKQASVQLGAKKYFNRRAPHGSEYSFILSDEDGNVLQRVNNDGADISFAPLYFDAEGTYTFYISEEKGRDNKVKYDTARYTVTVEISLERDYKAQVSVSLGTKPHEGDIAFFNSSRSSPPTGDNSNIPLFAALMLLSGAAATVLIRHIKKKEPC